MIFSDRRQAGEAVAERVARLKLPGKPLVLGLPRGGLPVADPVARRLGADLDIVVARKIGAPDRPEFGVGAIAEDGPPVFDERNLRYAGVTEDDVAPIVAEAREELRRRIRDYRGDRPVPPVRGRAVILVDDGLATGVTARAAISWLRAHGVGRVILAVPVCAPAARDLLGADAEVICLHAPDRFAAVGQWYDDFAQLSDADVKGVLSEFITC
ncbi:phosphoribosyltransferase [Actinoplanes sp. OR16]|uniref:phosphoribosyltransferase n=1 Tax=Actinoplanes sp. OR16 TaxID=946334 RepID=UPI000F6D12D5|nr:phosphoribosyltransferase family protein [Actinoplanes sp. OR16]BBH68093.1 phosphoribosyltransferase [Actinoplanes sp. OR16]